MDLQKPPVPRCDGGLVNLDFSTTTSLGLKRPRPHVPKLSRRRFTGLDLKALIDHAWQRVGHTVNHSSPTTQHRGGGTSRWNPMEEQVGVLEMLYGRRLRTPNAKQIEQIAAELRRYGRIEGKNVFYWFQNHKARERQKRHRHLADASTPCATSTGHGYPSPLPLLHVMESGGLMQFEGMLKRRRSRMRDWSLEITFELGRGEGDNRSSSTGRDVTLLELFPLHPESRESR